MEEMIDELKRLAQRLLGEKWEYKKSTKPYVKDVMKYMDQDSLMRALDNLNLKELEQIQGCGVPGDAWRHCNDLIRQRKEEIDLIIKKQGAEATATVDHNTITETEDHGTTGV
jgi:hypothetical protein